MTIDKVSISQARQADAEALSTFASRLFRETYSADLTPADLAEYISKSFRAEHQEAEIADPAGAVFIAAVDGGEQRIAGYAHIAADDANPGSLFLNRLYVDASWRGLGLAGRLLEEVVRECRQRGVDHLRLTVYEKNDRAIGILQALGICGDRANDFYGRQRGADGCRDDDAGCTNLSSPKLSAATCDPNLWARAIPRIMDGTYERARDLKSGIVAAGGRSERPSQGLLGVARSSSGLSIDQRQTDNGTVLAALGRGRARSGRPARLQVDRRAWAAIHWQVLWLCPRFGRAGGRAGRIIRGGAQPKCDVVAISSGGDIDRTLRRRMAGASSRLRGVLPAAYVAAARRRT